MYENKKEVSYNIIFKSVSGIGPTISSKTYFFDWSILENGNYELSYSFMSLNSPNQQQNLILYINLGNHDTFEVLPLSGVKNSNFLCVLNQYSATNFKSFFERFINSKTQIINRPSNNNITVDIKIFVGTNTFNIEDYILNLNLKKI
jgi:hypothetical protein